MEKIAQINKSKFDVLNLNINNLELRNCFLNTISNLPPVARGPNLEGWSVLSSNGDYQDGWNWNCPLNGPHNLNPTWIPKPEVSNEIPIQNYNIKTQICIGYLNDLMDQLNLMGFFPRRARIIKLKSKSSIAWHTDSQPGSYSIRLHIPIITNVHSFFEYRDEKLHMPANGSGFLVDITQEHRIVNEGLYDRVHLVMNIWDTKKISSIYQFPY